jgi:glycosyltransferase involved in cell wall biosynthesis
MRLVRTLGNWLLRLMIAPIGLVGVLLFALYVGVRGQHQGKKRIVFGPTPLVSYRYWSEALRSGGFDASTLVYESFEVNNDADFIRYTDSAPKKTDGFSRRQYAKFVQDYVVFAKCLVRYDVFHHTFRGGFLGNTLIWRAEAYLLRLARKKTVVIAYGSDVYMYSRLANFSVRHATLAIAPEAARKERAVAARVNYWTRNADIIVAGFILAGLSRWDIMVPNSLCIDERRWVPKRVYAKGDGIGDKVVVLHTPNHRLIKGTEFLIAAVERLKRSGLKVELMLLEGVHNEEVRRVMRDEADILVEQIIDSGSGLSGIEGMASGLPVMVSLHDEHAKAFRRYSFFGECPVVSTCPETLEEDLRVLIGNPHLREELGRVGRAYVEKYHSRAAAVRLFGEIYRYLDGEPVDLRNFYHPLLRKDAAEHTPVRSPLVDNRLPRPLASGGIEARDSDYPPPSR